ncbi:hypothetical protein B0T26DRAFT_171792 [Lasiosphaeria miniovina]|uniref:Secreted protein n=1 Tax=Lasiosphaeria miniovina TaxID=1954250 RepID=A0AA40E7Z0_9PEZI|nr:uncharacterized protein B0T26DRAFT_171792 [Lasiosphaeria miniovina]KAK0728437.1 hypothetical protein B0T26DRAFT_171792 [Lasiosphaeria miniovina]
MCHGMPLLAFFCPCLERIAICVALHLACPVGHMSRETGRREVPVGAMGIHAYLCTFTLYVKYICLYVSSGHSACHLHAVQSLNVGGRATLFLTRASEPRQHSGIDCTSMSDMQRCSRLSIYSNGFQSCLRANVSFRVLTHYFH